MSSSIIEIREAKAVAVEVTADTLSVELEDGRTVSVPVSWFPRLHHATPEERANLQIIGAGYGIHWPDLDEDISVDGIIRGFSSNESQSSFSAWLKGRE
jgi:hypothetical protein